jgi:protein O-GlcNAc transferase
MSVNPNDARQRRGQVSVQIAIQSGELEPIELERRSGEVKKRAKALADAGRWELATPLYRELLAEVTDDTDALRGLGLAALHGDRPGEAVGWLLRAHYSSPYSVSILSELGLAQKRCGLGRDAISSYRRALMLDERNLALLVNLGRAERESGSLGSAILAFRRAIAVDPSSAGLWSMQSNALREAGRLPEALEAARKAVELDRELAEAHLNEGAALHASGAFADAVLSYFVAQLSPGQRDAALANLKVAVRMLGKQAAVDPGVRLVARWIGGHGDPALLCELAALVRKTRPWIALVCLERAQHQAPSAAVERQLAGVFWDLGREQPALEHLLHAIASDRRDVLSYRLLGEWLSAPNKISLESPGWRRLFDECPPDVPALRNIGVALRRRGLPMSAVVMQRRALELDPTNLAALVNLGAALSTQGEVAEAIAVYRRALAIEPTHLKTWSNLLFSLHLDPEQSPGDIFEEHRRFGKLLGSSAAQTSSPDHPRVSGAPARATPLDGRRLRVGYVSPDFRSHPVAHFIEPVLAAHDRRQVEVFCYSDVEHPDDVTARLARTAEHFSACAGWSDAKLRERIVADGVDVLVDLTGHTGNNRLSVFATRPCPIQVSWLGYFDTSGLGAIDYRIADAVSVPANAERYFVERVVRLPRSANCFLPPAGPEPSQPPCLARGHITFGCYNNPAKVNRRTVAVFARVLTATPGSKLLFKYLAFNDPGMRARYSAWFEEAGIAPERILFEGPSSLERFHESFSRIDIALDPFPYSGETTALHTLWMGVPLVALEGETLARRLASRVLRITQLDAWVARDEDDYVRIACELAGDTGRLERTRKELRGRLSGSALFDYPGVTRDLEAAYHGMLRDALALGAAGAGGT